MEALDDMVGYAGIRINKRQQFGYFQIVMKATNHLVGAQDLAPHKPIARYILKVLGNDVLFSKGLDTALKMERH
jgi:hypothetical protein